MKRKRKTEPDPATKKPGRKVAEESSILAEAPPLYGGMVATQTQPQPVNAATASPGEMVRVIQRGLSLDELDALREELALPLEQLSEKLGISRATLHRRKATGRLTADESDKVMRFARLLGQAVEVFDGSDRARQWLKAPQRGLGGATPLDYASTEVGARQVENLLGRIEYGVYS